MFNAAELEITDAKVNGEATASVELNEDEEKASVKLAKALEPSTKAVFSCNFVGTLNDQMRGECTAGSSTCPYLRLYFSTLFDYSFGLLLRASTMSPTITVIHCSARRFSQSKEVVSFFIGLFCEEKGPFGFLGVLSLSKSPKSQKGPFSNKTYR